jgi:hypothetical protein
MRLNLTPGVLIIALVLAGCGDGGASDPGGDPPVLADMVTDWTLKFLPDSPDFWSQVTVSVSFRATRDLAIHSLSIDTGELGPARRIHSTEYPAFLRADGAARLQGTRFVNWIPPREARLPQPDRWTWSGEDMLATFPVVRAGETFDLLTRGLLRDDSGELRVTAVLKCVALENLPGLLLLDEDSIRSSGPPSGGPATPEWAPMERVALTYRKNPALTPDPRDSLIAGVYSAALPKAEWESCGGDVGVVMELVRETIPPPLTLAAARAKTGIPAGAASYFPRAHLWVLEDEEDTALVGVDGMSRYRGHLAVLFNALTGRRPAHLDLDPQALKDSLESHRSSIRALGFSVTPEPRKGWPEMVPAIEVTPKNVLDLLRVLRERDLKVTGCRVVPAN